MDAEQLIQCNIFAVKKNDNLLIKIIKLLIIIFLIIAIIYLIQSLSDSDYLHNNMDLKKKSKKKKKLLII